MLTLVVIGVVAGLVTALSPCVLPVLPGIMAASTLTGGPTGPGAGQPTRSDPRRPYLVVAGLLTSFTLLTLLGASLVTLLGIDETLLRNVALVVLIVVGVGLLVPGLGHRLEQIFYRVPNPGPVRNGSAFLFGLTLGVVFVPCAGPVLAAITVLAASQGLSWGLLGLTLAFSAGLALPLLIVARLGAGLGRRLAGHVTAVRRVAGAVFLVTGLAIGFGLADSLQRAVPGYVAAIQQRVEDSDAAQLALAALDPDSDAQLSFNECERGPEVLANCGPAPEFVGIADWLNTPDGAPLTLAELTEQGHVVLVDFWTYSCINCQRTLPYLTAWDAAYRDQGLTIVGVHSPEFGFEREVDNVADAAADFGVEYPIAIDNDFATWRAYSQRFWPAKYLVDRSGQVRQVHYGEGAYEETEQLIRELLAEQGAGTDLEAARAPAEAAPNQARTPETYLGYARARGYVHPITRDEAHRYAEEAAALPDDEYGVSLAGTWTVHDERIDAGEDAALTLDFSAAKVFLVLGGEGAVVVTEGEQTHEVDVSGAPTLYELRNGEAGRSRLALELDEGMSAYAFTFG